MTRLKFSSDFRGKLSEKLMDLGNYVLIALVFGQFATNTQFSPDIFKMGIAVGAICYMMSYLVSK